jgi:ribonucleotide reductase alpha subunit
MDIQQSMMRVQKRDGSFETVSFDKVLNRILNLSKELQVNSHDIAQKVCSRIFDGVKTSELDELAARMCCSLIVNHPDYGILASRIIISNHHKNTSPSFSETISLMYHNEVPLISQHLYKTVMAHKEKLNSYIDYSRDYDFDYFGFKTLERAYLTKVNDVIVERPQHLFMRVALGIHGEDIKDALETYDGMSKRFFVHATPTLFNSGTNVPQQSSCYLIAMEEDSIDGIYNTLKDCALISKYAGGIGVHIHNVRSRNSIIRGTNGKSTGIVPMLRVFNNTARYVNQCFRGDTIVYGKSGAVRMEEIKVGDELVTLDGTFKPVLQIAKNHVEKQILKIETVNSLKPIHVTKEHQVYSLSAQRLGLNNNQIIQRMEDGLIKPSFIEADLLKEGDFVTFPIPKHIQNYPDYDTDFFRYYGILICRGVINGKKIVLDFDNTAKNDCQTLTFVKDYLKHQGIEFDEQSENDFTIIQLYDDTLLLDIQTNFISDKYLHLPLDKTKALIRGICETRALSWTDEKTTILCCSEGFTYQMRYLLLRCGVMASSGGNSNSIVVPHSIFSDNPNVSNDYFEYDGSLWTRIRSIEEVEHSGYVYDFNMQDNHNYLTDMGLVHNSGRRNGSIAVYLEPWHADIEPFLEMKKNHGSEEERARDLFYALWIPDLFMERVRDNGIWSLMCPDECRGLSDVYGEEFKTLYERYESEGKFRKQLRAQELWQKILQSQIETGTPYMCYKDAANRKSNQKNLGVIKSSNLCVSGDTQILTSNGYFPIKDLVDQEVEVWNGEEFSSTIVRQTGVNQKLITVRMSNGLSLRCTPYHKFIIDNGLVEAKDLSIGMNVPTFKLPDNQLVEGLQVSSIEDNNEYEDTYCFNEQKLHQGIFNGILTGQCSEIMEYSDKNESAVCNLASISLPTYVKTNENGQKYYDFNELHAKVKIVTKNLNKIIDNNFYPTGKTELSNYRHRPIGIGVQGLADAFVLMRMPFDSPEASRLNREIFETIYHSALEASMELSKKRNEWYRENNEKLQFHPCEKEALSDPNFPPGAYSTFVGSPASQGLLQFDLWGVQPSDRYDWASLKADIQTHGLRNSLLLAPMPTASTSQILGFNECFEPFTSNLYKRKTLAGEFIIVNKYLLNDLIQLGLWNSEMKDHLIVNEGSVQGIPGLPQEIKDLYKTVWEIKQRVIVDLAADRGAFVCQSQSMNVFMDAPDTKKLTSLHFYAWQRGLKTGMYYLRTKPKATVQQFTIDPSKSKSNIERNSPKRPVEEPVDWENQGCTSCSA